jgi:multiple sugar transport system permease protein
MDIPKSARANRNKNTAQHTRPGLSHGQILTVALKTLVSTVLSVGGILMVLPFIWMLLSAFKPTAEIIRTVPTFFPEAPTLENFRAILSNYSFGRYLLNSLIVSTTTSLLILFTSSIVGFVFAKIEFRGREVLFLIFLATMALPFEIIAIPLFLEMKAVGGVDRLWGLVVPFAIDIFGIYLFRQFIAAIPDDYLDAARVDGLSEWGIYWRIILPLVRPALAALAILSFLYHWDSVFWPLILISSEAKKTVPLGIILLSTQWGTIYDLTMAASALTILPVLVVFFIFRRQFIQGIVLSGLKG